MSKKKLLEESTIRSFMKLANLQPLTARFLKEAEEAEEKEDEDEDESEEDESEEDESEEAKKAKNEEVTSEGKESEGRPASKSQPAKGTSLAGKAPGKMDAAKNAAGDAKLTALKAGTHHSGKPDSIQFTDKSNAPKKNNSTFEIVSESLQEMEDEEAQAPDMGAEAPEAPEADSEMDSAGEGDEHQGKMKELIRGMLNSLKDMGAEYGMSMEISDEGGEPEAPEADAEMAPPESGDEVQGQEAMMESNLDEIVEKLTRRVASRLVKETKKKR